ncbi:MAG: NAD(P)-dependent alcohol dehydrogenase [Acidobacteriaceae bacterium]|nr:NAD(P)-dependent alcohol dehydrogenase [Acidobacteriaceae bacterium]
MSQALRLHAFGYDGLRLEELTLPQLGPNDVHVRFHAASLNYRDIMTVHGFYNPKLAMPRILGSDAAGEVVAVGSSVTRFQPGDRVASLFFDRWHEGEVPQDAAHMALGDFVEGVFATERIMPEHGLIAIPDSLSFEQAAALPCAGVTAWNALVEKGHLRAGETVLILGTGGVSIFALQIAKAHGARVLLTSSSDEKLALGKSLGADELINYRTTPEWQNEVLRLTGTGVDHVVEVGGAGTLPRSLQAVRSGGHVHLIGVLSEPGHTVDPIPVLMKSIHLNGVFVGSRGMFERLLAAVVTNKITPVVDKSFPLQQYREAFEHMQTGRHFGKVLLSLK